MKKFIYIACIALGSCVLLGCGNNGAAKENAEEIENDTVVIAQVDSIVD